MNEPRLSKTARHTLQSCQPPCTFCSRWLGELSTSSESHWLRTQPATIILSRSKEAGCAELLSIKPHYPYSTSLLFSPPHMLWSILSSSISAVQPCGSLVGGKPSSEPEQEHAALELSSWPGMSLHTCSSTDPWAFEPCDMSAKGKRDSIGRIRHKELLKTPPLLLTCRVNSLYRVADNLQFLPLVIGDST